MSHSVKSHNQAKESTLVVGGVSPNETSFFQFIEQLPCKWVRLSYGCGAYTIQLKFSKKSYHYAQGKTFSELLQNLQERLRKFSIIV